VVVVVMQWMLTTPYEVNSAPQRWSLRMDG